jgi:hypothetical protein
VGFYIRKSLKAGPLRFNLSKSGVGVSAGVPGFRVGTGPRGNYVHAGRNGLYYRATLGGGGRRGAARRQQPGNFQPQIPASHQPTFNPSGILMDDVAGATAMALMPTAGGDIVEQLNAAAGRFRWGWFAAVFVGILALTYPRGIWLWLVLALPCVWLIMQDQVHSKVVLFSDLHDAHYSWFETLFNYWGWLTTSQRVWRVIESGATNAHQAKINAGAGHVVNRVVTKVDLTGPKTLETNIAVPSITAGNAALYFLPDRVLVRDGKRFSDVAYAHLTVQSDETRFIEDSAPPSDAPQVGQTWQYVNKSGGPDKRFNNNRVLPIMDYGQLDITSPAGLRWRLQVSKKDSARAIAQVLSSAPR